VLQAVLLEGVAHIQVGPAAAVAACGILGLPSSGAGTQSGSCCRKLSNRCVAPTLLVLFLPLLLLLLLPPAAAAAPCGDRPAREPSLHGRRPLPRPGSRSGERREVREEGWAGGGVVEGSHATSNAIPSAAPLSEAWHLCIDYIALQSIAV
jgi:hypothetical protein